MSAVTSFIVENSIQLALGMAIGTVIAVVLFG